MNLQTYLKKKSLFILISCTIYVYTTYLHLIYDQL